MSGAIRISARADDIIGDGSEMIGSMNIKNVIHFMKMEQENTMVELMKDIDRY